jgi:tRNA(Ile)-lysidine synthase
VQQEGPKNNGIKPRSDDYPLTIRCFQNGDKIKTKGGTKKVSRLFIDRKVPANKRKIWPIVLNHKNEILLVPGLAKHKDYLEDEPTFYIIPL